MMTDKDDDTPELFQMVRLLAMESSGDQRKCEGCGDWLKPDEERAKILYLFPDEQDDEWERAGSHMSPGPAPVFVCTQCLGMMEDRGEILIEPKE